MRISYGRLTCLALCRVADPVNAGPAIRTGAGIQVQESCMTRHPQKVVESLVVVARPLELPAVGFNLAVMALDDIFGLRHGRRSESRIRAGHGQGQTPHGLTNVKVLSFLATQWRWTQ